VPGGSASGATINIGFVTPLTGPLAGFASGDRFVLSTIQATPQRPGIDRQRHLETRLRSGVDEVNGRSQPEDVSAKWTKHVLIRDAL
jgi:hypothetical protein